MNAVTDSDVEARARLHEGIQCSQTLVALYDQDDRLRYANEAFSHAFPSARAHRCTEHRHAYSVELANGTHLWMTETRLPDGWLLTEAADITALKQTETSLRAARDSALEASQTDYLTKLPNRRYGFELLSQTLRAAQAQKQALSIALIDLDFFKGINDRYGHSAGDSALCQFAKTCYANLRAVDTVARIGGEEFLIIFPGVRTEPALDILNRLHQQPIQVSLESGAVKFSYTFSAGIAQASETDSKRSLLARADQALYTAKARGRNAIQVAATA